MFYRIGILLLLASGSLCFAGKGDFRSGDSRHEEIQRDVMAMKLKKDSFRRSRGGNSAIYEIRCADCDAEIMYYQKDGEGRLLRCYLDRIMYPRSLEDLAHDRNVRTKNDVPNLICSQCNKLIGVPMLYSKNRENRLAFRMFYGNFSVSTKKVEGSR